MKRPIFLIVSLIVTATALSCSGGNVVAPGGNASPTAAYKALYDAVKSKNTDAIKQQLTKKTIEFGQVSAQRMHETEDQVFVNGFTGTTFSDTLPPMRDERVKDKMGALEVWNAKRQTWEDLPFMFEDGSWKLAMGEGFAGSYKSPGKGRDQLEKEAANAATNSNVVVNVPVAGTNTANK